MIMGTDFFYDDATVTGFTLAHGVIDLKLECCTERDDIAVDVSLSFRNVTNLQVGSLPATGLGMVEEDGEIISYLRNAHRAEIIIRWNHFGPTERRRETVSYSFDFQSFDLSRSADILRSS